MLLSFYVWVRWRIIGMSVKIGVLLLKSVDFFNSVKILVSVVIQLHHILSNTVFLSVDLTFVQRLDLCFHLVTFKHIHNLRHLLPLRSTF